MSQFLLLPQWPLKMTLAINVVKIDSKIIISLLWSNSSKLTVNLEFRISIFQSFCISPLTTNPFTESVFRSTTIRKRHFIPTLGYENDLAYWQSISSITPQWLLPHTIFGLVGPWCRYGFLYTIQNVGVRVKSFIPCVSGIVTFITNDVKLIFSPFLLLCPNPLCWEFTKNLRPKLTKNTCWHG